MLKIKIVLEGAVPTSQPWGGRPWELRKCTRSEEDVSDRMLPVVQDG